MPGASERASLPSDGPEKASLAAISAGQQANGLSNGQPPMQLQQLLLVRSPLLTQLVLLQEARHDMFADAIWCVLVQSRDIYADALHAYVHYGCDSRGSNEAYR